MGSRNNRTNTYLQSNDINNCGNVRYRRCVRNLFFAGSARVLVIGIALAALLLSAGSASGQFIVSPMKIMLQPRPGRPARETIEIQSHDPSEISIIDFRVAELSQDEYGEWIFIEPNDPILESGTIKLSSCREWISFDPNTISLNPLTMAPVVVTLKVPPRIRGFYGAAILATLRPRPDVTGVAFVLRFLIPVLVEIQGRIPRNEVEMTDIGMEFSEPNGLKPATTLVTMDIANEGGTYSSLTGLVRVRGFWGGHWREITVANMGESSIIPGAKFKLRHNIMRSLPPGRYRLHGALFVDGRPVKGIEKEIDFAGDPRAKKTATDAPLILEPREITIDSLPGATRTTTLKVHNIADETVSIRTIVALPRILDGIARSDGLKGEDLNCAEWVSIEPDKFTIGANSSKNIRIMSEMPNPTSMHPCYYAILYLQALYSDGQNAGVTTAPICVLNKRVEASPTVQKGKLTLSELEGPSKYLVVSEFSNFGSIHFEPHCRVALTTLTGITIDKIILSSSKTGLMIPFETRSFSGVFDFSKVAAGTYRVTGLLEYAPGEVLSKQIAIQVSVFGDQRVVQILQLEEELEEKIDVQW